MYKPREVNILDEELLSKLKLSLGESIESCIKIADTETKTVELTCKMVISIEPYDVREEGYTVDTYNQPKVDYKVTRTIKESKMDFKGSIPEKVALEYDDDGHVILVNKDNQVEFDV